MYTYIIFYVHPHSRPVGLRHPQGCHRRIVPKIIDTDPQAVRFTILEFLKPQKLFFFTRLSKNSEIREKKILLTGGPAPLVKQNRIYVFFKNNCIHILKNALKEKFWN